MKPHELQSKLQSTVDHFKEVLSDMRTGSANPSMVENIQVQAYEGSASMNLRELANITVVDASLLTVEPWDKSITSKIEKAILSSGKNLNPAVEGAIIRVPVPQPTEETRKQYVKQAKEKLEEAKIAVRNIRQDAIKSAEEQEDEGVISEDELNRTRKTVEDSVKSINQKLEEMFKAKEAELMKV